MASSAWAAEQWLATKLKACPRPIQTPKSSVAAASGWFDHPCSLPKTACIKRFSRTAPLKMKGFRRNGRLGTNGEGGEPIGRSRNA
jgi:hypothetical protein